MRVLALTVAALVITPVGASPPAREIVKVPGWAPGSNKSYGIKAGGMVYTMGLTGTDMSIESPPQPQGNITAQTCKALRNMKALLAAAGTGLDQVMTCSVQLLDLQDFAAMNSVYSKYFPKAPPSRIAVAAKGLLPAGALVEVACIAALPGAMREIVTVPGWPQPHGVPLSMATKTEGIIFVSGMQGINMTTGVLASGVEAQTNTTMANIKTILQSASSSLESLLACEVSLADINDFATMTAAYKSSLPSSGRLGGLPSRVAVQVGDLLGGSKVEIKCVAAEDTVSGRSVNVPGWPTTMPFSSATVAKGMVYAAGVQGYFMKEGRIAPGGVGPETKQALLNLQEELKAAGAEIKDTVTCDISVKDLGQMPAVQAEIATVWPQDPPALTVAAIAGLAGKGAVEIKCVAAMPSAVARGNKEPLIVI